MAGITKSFPGVTALSGVDLELHSGEVLAICGENGAGKSTLMKILAGIESVDRGELVVGGETRNFASPQAAHAAGIAIVTQEGSIVPTLDVAANIMLGRETEFGSVLVDRQRLRAEAAKMGESFGIDLPLDRDAGELSRGEQQLIEICRAISYDARILILDEPTSALAVPEREHLFEIIDRLRSHGVGLIYISHILPEVMRVADRVTVLRDGAHISTRPIGECSEASIVKDMIGREAAIRASRGGGGADSAGAVLELEAVRTDRLDDVSLTVAPGEIVGLAGMMGSGRTEVMRAIFGLDPVRSGGVRVAGDAVQVRNPRAALRLGMALVPEDRHADGIVHELSVERNIALAVSPRRGVWADRADEGRLAEEFVERFRIRVSSPRQEAGTLSGGNQQKVLISRALATRPKLLALDEPTAGVDIGAKEDIIRTLREIADEGTAVLAASSELPELVALCDRVVVMRAGRSVATLAGSDVNEDAIGHHATGVAVAEDGWT